MYVLRTDIQIGNYTFKRANSVVIERSADLVTDKATIKVPVTAVLKDENSQTTVEVAKAIKVGDPVLIDVYYQGYEIHASSFIGYVKQLNYKFPLEIICEDATWLLRQKNINKSWQTTTLKQVLTEIVSGTTINLMADVPSITLKPFYLKNVTGLFALQKLKDEYGLTIYLVNGNQLYCGLAYTENYGTVKYVITGKDTNVVNADDLKWHSADDMRLKVKAIAISGNNTRTSVEVGDSDGAVRTLHYYNVENEATLKDLANQEMSKLKFDGYEGKITTFLLPNVLPGMVASITDERFPDRAGDYFVESVKTTWGTGGGRQQVEIGVKV